MSVLQIKDGSVIFGHPPILDGVNFVLEPNERVCIVGRNGSGKSTFLQVIEGLIILDDGVRVVDNNYRISRLPQDPPASVNATLFDYVAQGLEGVGELIKAYHEQTIKVTDDPSEANLNVLMDLQNELDTKNAWGFEQSINQTLTMLNLNADDMLSSLSGGWRRKAALARAIVSQPDILLLDEPTNHLDIEMIAWLEAALKQFKGSVVFISHDRAFIRSLATRIVDLDRGTLTSYPGNYEEYLAKKAHDLEVQATQDALFDKKLALEEVWIRQGIKARRTRNEGRVRALEALRGMHQARRKVQGNAKIEGHVGQSSGKRVFEATGLRYSIGGQCIVKDLDIHIVRGDKIAFIGSNGCGKSTLIKLLMGQLTPDSGEVIQGVNLEVAYFDQHRDALDLNQKVMDCVAEGKQEVMINGRPRHVISYLQDYLFAPDRIQAPVSSLSGGEKNRLMLAKLMLRPSNLLILDEPTNDLDVETLELLESLLVEYKGTVILVSHDREFVDNVVSSCVVFEGEGVVTEFVGGYTDSADWYAQDAAKKTANGTKPNPSSPKSDISLQTKPVTKKTKKLSYKDNLELEQLPAQIESLENEVSTLESKMNSEGFYSQTPEKTQPVIDALTQVQASLETAYARWDELEELQQS